MLMQYPLAAPRRGSFVGAFDKAGPTTGTSAKKPKAKDYTAVIQGSLRDYDQAVRLLDQITQSIKDVYRWYDRTTDFIERDDKEGHKALKKVEKLFDKVETLKQIKLSEQAEDMAIDIGFAKRTVNNYDTRIPAHVDREINDIGRLIPQIAANMRRMATGYRKLKAPDREGDRDAKTTRNKIGRAFQRAHGLRGFFPGA